MMFGDGCNRTTQARDASVREAARNQVPQRDGASTTTLESKTNFLAPAAVGTTVRAECVAIHRGRRTMVWQTRVTSETGKLLAIVTQTQMVLQSEPTK